MQQPFLKVKKLHTDVKDLFRAYDDSVGYDLHAYLLTEQKRATKMMIPPHSTRAIPTGIAVMPPPGYCVLVCSRSGLATRSIFISNAPGVIDPDYRGEIKVLLFNGSPQPEWVQHEDRIGQLLLVPAVNSLATYVDKLPETARGAKGLGSTGGVAAIEPKEAVS